MAPASEPSPAKGQAVYSPLVLGVYGFWVLGVSNHLLWRCPTRRLRALYDRNVTARHLDIGVGTGYVLDKARWPVPDPDITLLDLNPNSLMAASGRIRRYAPEVVTAGALKPLPVSGPFQSAGLCYLLHCLPGKFAEKCIVFDHVKAVMAPGARIFGATIVQGAARRNWAAQGLMDIYNAKGVFSNSGDCVEIQLSELSKRFFNVQVQCEGSVVLFEAITAGS